MLLGPGLWARKRAGEGVLPVPGPLRMLAEGQDPVGDPVRFRSLLLAVGRAVLVGDVHERSRVFYLVEGLARYLLDDRRVVVDVVFDTLLDEVVRVVHRQHVY